MRSGGLMDLGSGYRLNSVEFSKFSDEEWHDYINLACQQFREINHDDPFYSPEVYRKLLLVHTGNYEEYRWTITDAESRLAGRASLIFVTPLSSLYEDSRESCDISIDLLPPHRRKGIGSMVLRVILESARNCGKSKVQSEYILESGAEFTEKWGFCRASERSISRLHLDSIDWDAVSLWRNCKACDQGAHISILREIPEEDLVQFCSVYTACGQMAPDYDGDYVAVEQCSPASRRNDEDNWKKTDEFCLTAISREPDGSISGLSEIFYSPDTCHRAYQGLTGVLPRYRSRGLGKWLKFEITNHLKDNFPSVKYIETGNNNFNTHMLAINSKMGYRVHHPHVLVTGKMEDILENLTCLFTD